MNRIRSLIPALAGLIVLTLSACKKEFEKVNPCRILRFESYGNQPHGENDTVTATFSYDHRGNPTSIIFNETTTGRPNYFFKYDQKGRLIVFKGLWPETKAFDSYSFYQYDRNTIASDSAFYGGSDTSDLFYLTPNLFVGKYKFDLEGRLTEYDYDVFFPINPDFPPVHVNIKYTYDQNGNRIRGSYIYDNKINFLRTHPVLQFINRDYSINNPVPATSYNRFGLPLTFDHVQPATFMNTFVNKIVYSCD